MAGEIERPVWAGSESRAKVRFPISLNVRYSVVDKRVPFEGASGRTIDISSSGLSFTADKPLSVGQKLNLGIDWPVLLDGGVQLQMIVSGVIVRAGDVTAIQIEYHEFRTRRADKYPTQ